MSGLLSVVLLLACPVGMAAMMAIPALLRRVRRPSKPADAAPPVGSHERVLARQGGFERAVGEIRSWRC